MVAVRKSCRALCCPLGLHRPWLGNTEYCICTYFENAGILYLYYAVEASGETSRAAEGHGLQEPRQLVLAPKVPGVGTLRPAAGGQSPRRPGTAAPDTLSGPGILVPAPLSFLPSLSTFTIHPD